MKLRILATAALFISLCLAAPVQAENPEQVRQLLETKKCQGCDLSHADLKGLDLAGADLRNANLTDAFLGYTNLSHADLRGANLTGADLFDTNLSGANLEGAIGLDRELPSDGQDQ